MWEGRCSWACVPRSAAPWANTEAPGGPLLDPPCCSSAGEGAAGEGHGAARGAEQAAAAPSTPGGASALAGSPPSGFDGFARQVLEALENQGKLLASLSEKQDSMSKTLDSQGQLLASQGKTLDSLKGVPATVGAVSENLVRVKRVVVGEDEEYRPRVLMTSDADVLRVCSTPDFPASKQRLVNELMAEHLAYTALLHLVLPQLKGEAHNKGVKLPKIPDAVDSWPAEGERYEQVKQALLAARRQRSGKAAWLPAVKGLLGYASAAANSCLRSYLLHPEQGRVLLMLLAARAADQQLEALEFDAVPLLKERHTEQGTALRLDLLEVKSSPDGIKGAVRQLVVRARILVYVLATANAPLLAAHGPLQVEGTVEVAGEAPSPSQHKQWAGKQRDVGCAAAPDTAQLSMQLRLLP